MLNNINATIEVKQMQIGNYTKRDGGSSFFVYALGYDGIVYRWDDRQDGWIQIPMFVRSIYRDEMEGVEREG